MKKNRIIVLVSIITVLLIGLASFTYAETGFKSPAEIIAGLTGKSVDEVTAARQDGTSYGAQAKAAGKLDEFQASRLELYKQNLDQAVADKRITQEEADKLYAAMKLRLETCEGTGIGNGAGNGSGSGQGMMGQRRGSANGTGTGLGKGGLNRGSGLGRANCTATSVQ